MHVLSFTSVTKTFFGKVEQLTTAAISKMWNTEERENRSSKKLARNILFHYVSMIQNKPVDVDAETPWNGLVFPDAKGGVFNIFKIVVPKTRLFV